MSAYERIRNEKGVLWLMRIEVPVSCEFCNRTTDGRQLVIGAVAGPKDEPKDGTTKYRTYEYHDGDRAAIDCEVYRQHLDERTDAKPGTYRVTIEKTWDCRVNPTG